MAVAEKKNPDFLAWAEQKNIRALTWTLRVDDGGDPAAQRQQQRRLHSGTKFEFFSLFFFFYSNKMSQGNNTETMWANGMLSQSHHEFHQTAIPFDPPVTCFVIV